MDRVDKKGFKRGLWLGLLAVLVIVTVFELFRLLPLSTQQTLQDLNARLLNQETDSSYEEVVSTEEPSEPELTEASAVVGSDLTTTISSDHWQWIEGHFADGTGHYSLKIPPGWFTEELPDETIRLLDENGLGSGIEITLLSSKGADLSDLLILNSHSANVAEFSGEETGLVSSGSGGTVYGFEHKKSQAVIYYAGTELTNIEAIAASFSWL